LTCYAPRGPNLLSTTGALLEAAAKQAVVYHAISGDALAFGVSAPRPYYNHAGKFQETCAPVTNRTSRFVRGYFVEPEGPFAGGTARA